MPSYMVVCSFYDEFEEKTVYTSNFTDDYSSACNCRMDCACGLGGKAQIYIWDPSDDEYKFLEE